GRRVNEPLPLCGGAPAWLVNVTFGSTTTVDVTVTIAAIGLDSVDVPVVITVEASPATNRWLCSASTPGAGSAGNEGLAEPPRQTLSLNHTRERCNVNPGPPAVKSPGGPVRSQRVRQTVLSLTVRPGDPTRTSVKATLRERSILKLLMKP